MNRESRPVTSREYKMMLRASRFEGGKKKIIEAAERYREAFAKAVEDVVVQTDGKALVGGKLEPVEVEKQVTVQFLDTKDLRLRRSGHVFRQRQPVAGGPLELTLKFRHPDRFLASSSETGGKTKFEEDIKASHTHDFISLHSLSGKAKKVDAGTVFSELKDIRGFFEPIEKQLNDAYKPSAKLRRVGRLTAVQTVLEGPKFKINDGTFAECALIVWHRRGGRAKKPVVVEFSFRYKDKDLGPATEPFTAEMARRCFDILQAFRAKKSPLARWVDLKGPTKTAYTYSLEKGR